MTTQLKENKDILLHLTLLKDINFTQIDFFKGRYKIIEEKSGNYLGVAENFLSNIKKK